MAVVNRPNGRDARRGGGRILRDVMRCRRLCYFKRGQAIVETALLLPLLMLLTMGSADLGRVFYYSIAVTNAAREAARQGTYYDPTANPPANTYDDYADILAAAQRDVPTDVTLTMSTIAPLHCLTGPRSSWSANYPTDPNTGYVYICFDGQDNPPPSTATSTIQVTILYNFQPVTPLADIVGASTVHVEASTTMQVQHQQ
ncbi:MAG: pilus assembly protein [Chloroflexi bacterium]|nr:MAG: pilus assembly protein [Chloroflexota bacterium]TMD48619.1 MAG: pilus assembly protein [Chloroflexota bacterium]